MASRCNLSWLLSHLRKQMHWLHWQVRRDNELNKQTPSLLPWCPTKGICLRILLFALYFPWANTCLVEEITMSFPLFQDSELGVLIYTVQGSIPFLALIFSPLWRYVFPVFLSCSVCYFLFFILNFLSEHVCFLVYGVFR